MLIYIYIYVHIYVYIYHIYISVNPYKDTLDEIHGEDIRQKSFAIITIM